jgi:hypothetical protein
MDFHSAFDTFIQPGSAKAYSIYQEREANLILPPGETIELYVEPVGFEYKSVLDQRGNPPGQQSQAHKTSGLALF